MVTDIFETHPVRRRQPVRWIGLLAKQSRNTGGRVHILLASGAPRHSIVSAVLRTPKLHPVAEAPPSHPRRAPMHVIALAFSASFLVSMLALAGGATVALTGGFPTHHELSVLAEKVLPGGERASS